MVALTMEGLEVEYSTDHQRMFIKLPKRKYRVVIERVNPSSSLFRIRYESGASIPKLSGTYTGKREALRALKVWNDNQKESKAVFHDERFGPESEKPEFKYKDPKKGRPRGTRKVKNEPADTAESG